LVYPLAAVEFRVYPEQLAPLGIFSLRAWRNIVGYLPKLEFAINGPMNAKLTRDMDINAGGCNIPTDDQARAKIRADKDGENGDAEYISWDAPEEEEEGNGNSSIEPTVQHESSGSTIGKKECIFPTVCGYSMTAKQLVADGRDFYSHGIPVSRETCAVIFQSSTRQLLEHCDDVAADITVEPGDDEEYDFDDLVEAKSKKMKTEVRMHVQNNIMKTYYLFVANEGCPQLMKKIPKQKERVPMPSEMEKIIVNDKQWKRFVHKCTVFPVLPEGRVVSENLFELMHAVTDPSTGDAFVHFLCPSLFGHDDRQSVIDGWEKNSNESQLFNLMNEMNAICGAFDSEVCDEIPEDAPLCAVICKPHKSWLTGKEHVETYYGPLVEVTSEKEHEEDVAPSSTPPPSQEVPPLDIEDAEEIEEKMDEEPAKEPTKPVKKQHSKRKTSSSSGPKKGRSKKRKQAASNASK